MGLFDKFKKKAAPEIVFPLTLEASARGEAVEMEKIPDEVFSSGALGPCRGIKPSEGVIYAPLGGKISNLADTLHAVGIEGDGGVEEAGVRYMEDLKRALTYLTALSYEHEKLMCLSETGLEGLADPEWWTVRLAPAMQDFPLSYVLTWRNAHDQAGHFFAPWKGFENERDFKEFCQKEDIILLCHLKRGCRGCASRTKNSLQGRTARLKATASSSAMKTPSLPPPMRPFTGATTCTRPRTLI